MFFSINVNFSFKIIPFILIIIILFIKNCSENEIILFIKKNNTEKIENEIKSKLLNAFNIAIFNKSFYFFSIFFYLIYIKRNKKDNKNEDLTHLTSNSIDYNDVLIKPIVKVPYIEKKKKAILLSLLCVFLTIPIDTIKIKNSYKINYSSTVFGFITILFFNYFLFEKKLEKHKQLSIFLFCLFNLPLFICLCIWDKDKNLGFLFFDAVFFITNSIKFCIYQYIMNNLFISFYFIFFIEGLCFFTPFVIINIIMLLIGERKILREYYDLNLLLNNSIHFTVHYLYFLHINFYDAMNCMIMEIFSRGISSVINEINTGIKIETIIDLIFSILSVIFIFIYEEIIILNFCELDKYVQKSILKRKEEYENSFKNISMIEN